MKKVTLTEEHIENLVRKVLEEQGAVSGAATGMGRSEINSLPKCSKKNSEELIGGVVRKHEVTDSRLQAFQVAANKAGTGTELYLEVKKRPFCKLR